MKRDIKGKILAKKLQKTIEKNAEQIPEKQLQKVNLQPSVTEIRQPKIFPAFLCFPAARLGTLSVPGVAVIDRTGKIKDMIHLHTRSHYSLLEGTLTIDAIIQKALQSGQKAAVLSDHRSMFATMKFLRACKKAGLKPIIGLEFEVRRNEQIFSLLALARNTAGLQSLYALSTRLMSGEQALPFDQLKQYAADLVVMNAGADDLLESLAHESDLEAISEFFADLQDAAPDCYMAISLQDSPRYARSNQVFRSVAPSLGLECAALSRIEYGNPEEVKTLELLRAIGSSKTVGDPSIRTRSGRYWRSLEEMEQLYQPEELEITDQIAEKIGAYEIPKAQLPVFINKTGAPSSRYLTSLCHAGLKKRCGANIPAVYKARLERELDVILSMGFADYFLIVWDFIREARKRNILVGPGRGSAAGSLVAYCLGISHIDPVANGLLFERFLNPSRISMPDIDTDFPDNRRDEIIDYVQDVYGRYHAAHIVTFAREKTKSALRDCARALGLPLREVDRLCKMLPNTPGLTLHDAYQNNRQFASLIDNNPRLALVYESACQIEGFPRHASIHAGGIVLARDPILNQAPLLEVGENLPAVQFTMDYLEEIGLIKFDFLSLRNLTTLAAMADEVVRQSGRSLDLLKLPLNDPSVYSLLRNGQTLGIFQLESSGIRDLIVRYKPERFEDIAAILALYRPGPMKNIDLFLSARFHPQLRKSIHPLLDDLLAETGGIFVYQEQIMEAARILGDFSLAEADSLRKAMSKKKPEEMARWEAKFVAGASQKQIEEGRAREIFQTMSHFAEYGFNKSHSYVYGLIVYQMAWIKARWPLAFYQCSLNACIGSGARTSAFLQECKSRRIPVAPISLNCSSQTYIVQNRALRMPLSLVKSINRQAIEKIEQERREHGPYTDPCLSVLRLLHIGLSSASVLALIQAGAFDDQQVSRESLENAYEEIVRLADLVMFDEKTNTWQFAGVTPPTIIPCPPQMMERLNREKELLGFYTSQHPSAILRQNDRRLKSVAAIAGQMGEFEICGIIHSIKEHKTRTGKQMAFAIVSDDTGDADLAIMPWVYEKVLPVLKNNQFVRLAVKKDDNKSMMVRQLYLLNS